MVPGLLRPRGPDGRVGCGHGSVDVPGVLCSYLSSKPVWLIVRHVQLFPLCLVTSISHSSSKPHLCLIVLRHRCLSFPSHSQSSSCIFAPFCAFLLPLEYQFVGEKRGKGRNCKKGMTRRRLVTMATHAACQSVALASVGLLQ